jgi:hypothetical protein
MRWPRIIHHPRVRACFVSNWVVISAEKEDAVVARGNSTDELDWQPVIARGIGLLCLHAEEMRGAPLVDQWLFLQRLGFPRDEAAVMLGTSSESLRVSTQRRKAQGQKKAR